MTKSPNLDLTCDSLWQPLWHLGVSETKSRSLWQPPPYFFLPGSGLVRHVRGCTDLCGRNCSFMLDRDSNRRVVGSNPGFAIPSVRTVWGSKKKKAKMYKIEVIAYYFDTILVLKLGQYPWYTSYQTVVITATSIFKLLWLEWTFLCVSCFFFAWFELCCDLTTLVCPPTEKVQGYN